MHQYDSDVTFTRSLNCHTIQTTPSMESEVS